MCQPDRHGLMYRGEIVAHLLGLKAPVEGKREGEGFILMAKALDAVMIEYCETARYEQSYLDRLLRMRRKMAPSHLVQNLCAFRAWLFGLKQHEEDCAPGLD